jgi:hypothetical protein
MFYEFFLILVQIAWSSLTTEQTEICIWIMMVMDE